MHVTEAVQEMPDLHGRSFTMHTHRASRAPRAGGGGQSRVICTHHTHRDATTGRSPSCCPLRDGFLLALTMDVCVAHCGTRRALHSTWHLLDVLRGTGGTGAGGRNGTPAPERVKSEHHRPYLPVWWYFIHSTASLKIAGLFFS